MIFREVAIKLRNLVLALSRIRWQLFNKCPTKMSEHTKHACRPKKDPVKPALLLNIHILICFTLSFLPQEEPRANAFALKL